MHPSTQPPTSSRPPPSKCWAWPLAAPSSPASAAACSRCGQQRRQWRRLWHCGARAAPASGWAVSQERCDHPPRVPQTPQIAMTRLNVRLRKKLFASLMRQDAGFFDTTKTGEITSRLRCLGARRGRCRRPHQRCAPCQQRWFDRAATLPAPLLPRPCPQRRHHHGFRPDLPEPERHAEERHAGARVEGRRAALGCRIAGPA